MSNERVSFSRAGAHPIHRRDIFRRAPVYGVASDETGIVWKLPLPVEQSNVNWRLFISSSLQNFGALTKFYFILFEAVRTHTSVSEISCASSRYSNSLIRRIGDGRGKTKRTEHRLYRSIDTRV